MWVWHESWQGLWQVSVLTIPWRSYCRLLTGRYTGPRESRPPSAEQGTKHRWKALRALTVKFSTKRGGFHPKKAAGAPREEELGVPGFPEQRLSLKGERPGSAVGRGVPGGAPLARWSPASLSMGLPQREEGPPVPGPPVRALTLQPSLSSPSSQKLTGAKPGR